MSNQGFWQNGLEGSADRLNAGLLQYAAFASRPAAGQTGRLFYATDTNVLYRDNGSSWDTVMPQGTPALWSESRHPFILNWNSTDRLTIETAGTPSQTYSGANVALSVDGKY